MARTLLRLLAVALALVVPTSLHAFTVECDTLKASYYGAGSPPCTCATYPERGTAMSWTGWNTTPVWCDEFNGTSLDESKWTAEDSTQGGGTENDAYYLASQVTVSGGFLCIVTTNEPLAGYSYRSGGINTRDKFNISPATVGFRVIVRGKLPLGAGYWPAYWMRKDPDGRPEFDILEYLGKEPYTFYGTNHWGTAPTHNYSQGTATDSLTCCWHTYAFDVLDGTGGMRWYMDGKEYFRSNCHQNPSATMCIIINTAIGAVGSWAGPPEGTTVFPQTHYVDWIRVYQEE